MNNPRILVIGATGHAGRETLISFSRDSRSANYKLYAGVKNVNLKDSMLDSFGFDSVRCDLDEPATVEKACQNATKVFLIVGNNVNRTEQCKNTVQAMKKANVKHFLFLSAVGCDTSESIIGKQFKECEEIIKGSGMNYTIIRCMFFQENLLVMGEHINAGNFRLAIGSASIAPVSLVDVGDAAANILLTDSSDHNGKTYNLTGDELLSGEEMAQVLAKVVGKEITYTSPSQEETKQFYLSIGCSEWEANGLADLLASFSRNEGNSVSKDVQKLCGRPATTLEQTLHSHKEKLTLRLPDGVASRV